jgi:hypothetical protein
MQEVIEQQHPQPQHIHVAVITTAGVWPGHGFESVPVHQKVRQVLLRAAHHLHVTDTSGWVAVADGKELNIEATYLENGLHGRVSIDYGPREGGGGHE